MKFGNWGVTENTLEWQGAGFHRYVIEKAQLLSIEESGEFQGLYSSLMRATQEDWLTGDDLYDLNFAFVFACARFGTDFNYETFDATALKIFEVLDDEEDEQVSLGDIGPDDADAEQKRKEALSERD